MRRITVLRKSEGLIGGYAGQRVLIPSVYRSQHRSSWGTVLYEKSEDLQPEMAEHVPEHLCQCPRTHKGRRFQMIIEDTLGEDGDYEDGPNIHETLHEMIEEHKEEPEPLVLDKTDVKKIFEEKAEFLTRKWRASKILKKMQEKKPLFLASNITEVRKFNIETPDVVIKVNPERADLVETRIIDGRQCLVIPVDDHIEVNGIQVKTIKEKK